MDTVNIFWFRRDLRLEDNAAFYHALSADLPVVPVFIFDKIILDGLDNKCDPRVDFIHRVITGIQKQLAGKKSALEIYYGNPVEIFQILLSKYQVEKVFTNHDYEPYAIQRDEQVGKILVSSGINFLTFKDHVILEKDEILKDDGKPYTVFTPYSRKWRSKLNSFYLRPYPVKKYISNLFIQPALKVPALESMGFEPASISYPSLHDTDDIIKKYAAQRNFPAVNGTSKLGIHLRFGTISIRALTKKAMQLDEVFLNELIWREFYQSILHHFPRIGRHQCFKAEYENIQWRNNEDEFARWCSGETGYPIVDAGMRELNLTGFMHNRVRMVVASFLSKHLLIDWRWGEAYFASKLLDFELASNNGGWQWAAGSGCDAAPYFRIFNPYLQTKKFDPELKYIKKWVPEFQEFSYPSPIVDHEFARKRCLEVYGKALKSHPVL
ncbi:MAG: deoxyribodipyrimidine photo-lyase [Ginsengibacter sp.]